MTHVCAFLMLLTMFMMSYALAVGAFFCALLFLGCFFMFGACYCGYDAFA